MMSLMIALLASSTAAAGTPAATPAAASAEDKKVICRTDPVLGSRIKVKKNCKTVAQWREYDAQLQQLSRDTHTGTKRY